MVYGYGHIAVGKPADDVVRFDAQLLGRGK